MFLLKWLLGYHFGCKGTTKNAFHGLCKAGDSDASESPWSGIEHNGKMDSEIRTNRLYRKTCNRFVQKIDTIDIRYNRIVIGYRCAADEIVMSSYEPIKNPL